MEHCGFQHWRVNCWFQLYTLLHVQELPGPHLLSEGTPDCLACRDSLLLHLSLLPSQNRLVEFPGQRSTQSYPSEHKQRLLLTFGCLAYLADQGLHMFHSLFLVFLVCQVFQVVPLCQDVQVNHELQSNHVDLVSLALQVVH